MKGPGGDHLPLTSEMAIRVDDNDNHPAPPHNGGLGTDIRSNLSSSVAKRFLQKVSFMPWHRCRLWARRFVVGLLVVLVLLVVEFFNWNRPMVGGYFSVPLRLSMPHVTQPPGARGVVFGVWEYDPLHLPKLELFLSSLRGTGYKGDVVLVSRSEEASFRAMCSKYDVAIMGYHYTLRGTLRFIELASIRYLLAGMLLGLSPSTELVGLDLVLARQWDQVMLTDTRDVYFQRDPFVAAQELQREKRPDASQFLIAAMEVGSTTITINLNADTSSRLNTRWVSRCFGEDAIKKLEGSVVSCSGTIIGDVATIRGYLRGMSDAFNTKPICGVTDQGVHNYLIRAHPMVAPHVIPSTTEEDPVFATLDRVQTLRFENATGRLLTGSGTEGAEVPKGGARPYAVVHQYNRCRYFVRHYFEGLPDGTWEDVSSKRDCKRLDPLYPLE